MLYLQLSAVKEKTILYNCAIEPEIKDLISVLNKLGSKILISGRKITVFENKKIKKKLD